MQSVDKLENENPTVSGKRVGKLRRLGCPTNLIFLGTCLHPFGNFLEKASQNTRRRFCSPNR